MAKSKSTASKKTSAPRKAGRGAWVGRSWGGPRNDVPKASGIDSTDPRQVKALNEFYEGYDRKAAQMGLPPGALRPRNGVNYIDGQILPAGTKRSTGSTRVGDDSAYMPAREKYVPARTTRIPPDTDTGPGPATTPPLQVGGPGGGLGGKDLPKIDLTIDPATGLPWTNNTGTNAPKNTTPTGASTARRTAADAMKARQEARRLLQSGNSKDALRANKEANDILKDVGSGLRKGGTVKKSKSKAKSKSSSKSTKASKSTKSLPPWLMKNKDAKASKSTKSRKVSGTHSMPGGKKMPNFLMKSTKKAARGGKVELATKQMPSKTPRPAPIGRPLPSRVPPTRLPPTRMPPSRGPTPRPMPGRGPAPRAPLPRGPLSEYGQPKSPNLPTRPVGRPLPTRAASRGTTVKRRR